MSSLKSSIHTFVAPATFEDVFVVVVVLRKGCTDLDSINHGEFIWICIARMGPT